VTQAKQPPRAAENPGTHAHPPSRRDARLFVGAALLLAGTLWSSGLAEPVALGWVGAGVGLVLLVIGLRGQA
jgi:hypothetical protein